MCKHVVYTTIVNFQMNVVCRRKIKNRKKIEARHLLEDIYYHHGITHCFKFFANFFIFE